MSHGSHSAHSTSSVPASPLLPLPASPSSPSTSTTTITSTNDPLLPPPKRKAPPIFHFAAGLATGSLSAILLQPADLLKTRVQQARGTSVTTALRQILAQPSALRLLWRGTLPSVIRTGFGSATYFAALNALRAAWAGAANTPQPGPSRDSIDGTSNRAAGRVSLGSSSSSGSSGSSSSALPRLSNTANLVTGALARGGAGFLLMPITVLKVRYESSLYTSYGTHSSGLVAAARAILARDGVRGLYAGYGATFVRDAPYAGLYVVFYEKTKAMLNAASGGGGGGPQANAVNFGAGVVAAAAATAVTNPFDAIKTRIQLMPQRYANLAQAAATMVREDGFRCLFDGLGLRMVRKGLSSALAWTIYEDLVRRAERRYAMME